MSCKSQTVSLLSSDETCLWIIRSKVGKSFQSSLPWGTSPSCPKEAWLGSPTPRTRCTSSKPSSTAATSWCSTRGPWFSRTRKERPLGSPDSPPPAFRPHWKVLSPNCLGGKVDRKAGCAEGAWMTSQLRHNFQASQAEHEADDITTLHFESHVDSLSVCDP